MALSFWNISAQDDSLNCSMATSPQNFAPLQISVNKHLWKNFLLKPSVVNNTISQRWLFYNYFSIPDLYGESTFYKFILEHIVSVFSKLKFKEVIPKIKLWKTDLTWDERTWPQDGHRTLMIHYQQGWTLQTA
jgi:hypothetical protein